MWSKDTYRKMLSLTKTRGHSSTVNAPFILRQSQDERGIDYRTICRRPFVDILLPYPDTVSLKQRMASMCWSGPLRPARMVFTDR